MKKKKFIAMILSLSMAASCTLTITASAAEGSVTLPEGYRFVDIAHNGDTYVAMAKNSTDNWASAKLLCSNDGGLTWEDSTTQPLRSGAQISNNRQSQQQLVWWGDKQLFVAHGGGSTYTSSDGMTWSKNDSINWTENTYLTVSGEYLILSGGSSSDTSFAAQKSLTTREYSNTKGVLISQPYKTTSVAVKPKDKSGDIYAFALGAGYAYYYKTSTPISTSTWEKIDENSSNIPNTVYDMIYAEGADQFIAVTNNGTLFVTAQASGYKQYEIKTGATVTGIGVSDEYIAVGLSDGSIFYTENAPITAETQWTELESDTRNEAIRCIEFSDDTNFVALSDTKVYIDEIAAEDPETTQASYTFTSSIEVAKTMFLVVNATNTKMNSTKDSEPISLSDKLSDTYEGDAVLTVLISGIPDYITINSVTLKSVTVE